MSEDDVQRAVVRHLEFRGSAGLVFFAVPNGGSRHRAEAAKMRGTGTKSGAPDLLAFHNGRAFGLELKRQTGGRVSPAQADMHDRLRDAGVVVAVACGLDEALETLKGWGLIK